MARSKGSGRLFKRAGRWYMRWRHGGRECTRTTGIGVDEPNAKKRALEMLDETTSVFRLGDKAMRLAVVRRMIETTEGEIADKAAGVRRDARLCDLAEMFRNSSFRADCSRGQLEVYCKYIARLASVMGPETRVADIDAGLAEVAMKRMSGAWSPNTYNKYLGGYMLVWKAVLPIMKGTANPWAALPRRKLDTNVRRVFTDEEIARVFEVAKGEERALFAIGLYTGLRLGDAVRLSWDDIRDGAVFIKTAKTGASVAIPLHPCLQRELERLGDKEGYVCPSLHARYEAAGRASVVASFARLFARCGIETSRKVGIGIARPVCGFHSLRHTFVSKCISAGIDRAIVQAIVGHSSAAMTEHYTHLADKVFLEAFSRVF